jgi:UDPglucose 6-dehydrogenase
MRLTVFGCGYVGLVTGACLSELGHEVLCVDISEERVKRLQDGIVPIYEPGLAELVRRNLKASRLTFQTTVTRPFDAADAYFIAVGTPASEDGSADTSAVFAVASEIASRMRHLPESSHIIVVKSTVPVGTCDAVAKSTGIDVVSNPEFLREGTAVHDFFYPDRIVIGARGEHAAAVVKAIYAPLRAPDDAFVMTDPCSSELTKYAANTMLAMRISFMNELSRLCCAAGANIDDVRVGVGRDTRIGPRFLYAGPGYGGSCFPKDVQALVHLGKAHGVDLSLAQAAHTANEQQIEYVAQIVENAISPSPKDLQGKTVAFWGLAFKPETDDVRCSPAVRLADVLLGRGVDIVGHDPEGGPSFQAAMGSYGPRVRVVERQEQALEKADALVLLTEWRCYRSPDFKAIAQKVPVVIDTRNVWDPASVAAAGLGYRSIGRSPLR